MSSLNPISREVQEGPQRFDSSMYAPREDSKDCLIACSRSIFPHDNIIRVVQKSHGEHYVKMSEVVCMGSKRYSLVGIAPTAHDGCCMVS